MKIEKRWFLGISIALLLVAGVPSVARGQAEHAFGGTSLASMQGS